MPIADADKTVRALTDLAEVLSDMLDQLVELELRIARLEER